MIRDDRTSVTLSLGEILLRELKRAFWVPFCLVMAIVPFRSEAFSVSAHLAFKPEVTLNDSIIHLGDIAHITCPDPSTRNRIAHTRAGETAPPGFSRYIVVSALLQRKLSSRLSDIGITTSGSERIRVTTCHKDIKIMDLKEDVEKYLQGTLSWPSSQCSIEILETDRVMKVLNAPCRIEIKGNDDPHAKGVVRLNALIHQGGMTLEEPITCKVRVKAPVLVTTSRIDRGTEVGPENCMVRAMDITNYRYEVYSSWDQVRGLRSRRTLSPGTIVHEKHLESLPLVEKGDEVFVELRRGAVTVSVAARARENGSLGERIWLENLSTHQLIQGTVRGKGKVAVPSKRISL